MTSLITLAAACALAAGFASGPQEGPGRAAREAPLRPAPAGTKFEVPSPAVEARLWIVAFPADFPPDRLPISRTAIEGVNRELGRGADAKGRIPTWGLAVQQELAKFEVVSPSHLLRVRDGVLVSEPVSAKTEGTPREAPSPPWDVISAPRVIMPLGQEAMVSVGRPVEYLTRDDDGCLRVESTESVTEGMELRLTASKLLEKGIRFTGIQLKVTRVEARQPIEGVPFDVGRPILDTRETQLDMTLDDGRIAMIPLPTRDGEPAIIVFFLATRVEK